MRQEEQVLPKRRPYSGKSILLVLPEAFGSAGGIQMFCRALCLATSRWAQDNGASVSALVLNDNGAPDAQYINAGFTSYVGAGKSKARLIKWLLCHIISSRCDLVVFGHVSLAPLTVLISLFNPRIKTVVITYGIEVWRPVTGTQQKALRRADLVLAISDFTKEELIKHNAIPAEKIRIFPCTLDPHWKIISPVTTLEYGPPIILSVTRMSKIDRYKCIDNVIKSIPTLVCEVGPVEYRIIGKGDDVPRLRALAAGLGVSRYINFIGEVSDAELRLEYQRCSIFVMPSKKEGFGIVFLEAMAYGKSIVGGAHGGTPSVVKDGVTGFLVDSSDVSGIAHSIARILRDEGLRGNFGRAGYQRLLDNFTFESFERNLDEVLLTLS